MGTRPGWVTDGGLETDLIYHRGFDLPAFAAFPLLEHDDGRAALADYFRGYAEIAEAARAGWKRFWRNHTPPLPHEEESRNKTSGSVIEKSSGSIPTERNNAAQPHSIAATASSTPSC